MALKLTKALVAGLLFIGATGPAWAEEPAAPVVDRIILKKKKAPPVVDRIVLKRPTKVEAAPVAPAPPPPQPAPLAMALPAPVLAPAAEAPLPDGFSLNMAYSSGPLDRVKAGFGLWFTDSLGLALQSGFNSIRDEKSIATSGGPRMVKTVTWLAAPEASLLFAPLVRSKVRLVLEAGGGLYFSKPEREATVRAYHAHLGPSLQWFVLPHYSLHLGERVNARTYHQSSRIDLGLSTELSASFWF